MLLALVKVRDPIRVVAPMSPEIEILPSVPALRVNAPTPDDDPFTVLNSVILVPATAVFRLPPDAVMAPANWIAPAAVMALPSVTPPAPAWVTAPLIEKVVPDKVTAPVFWMDKGPVPVVVTSPPKVNVEPIKLMPEAPLVSSAPKVVDPAS